MKSNLTKTSLLFPVFIALFLTGCSTLSVVDLNPQPYSSHSVEYETNVTASIDPLKIVAGDFKDGDKWKKGLADALRNEKVFHAISPSNKDQNTDFLIRGKVSGRFRPIGAKNFFTWWPGTLIFAHTWRGTRYIYDASSDIELVDTNSGEVLENYHAESSHELIHKSNNPWHFFSTFIIIPGTIKGSMTASPKAFYRQKIYEVAYPALWKKMALLIKDGQSKILSERMAGMKERCGERFNEEIALGMDWSEFVSCQTDKYRFLGQEPMVSGLVSIYLKSDKSIRVHVANDGRILRWYIAKPRE